MKKFGRRIMLLFILLWGIQSIDVFAVACTQTQHEFAVEILEYATGETDGLREYTCLYCGYSYTEVIPRTGHHFGEYHIQQAADCGTEGIRYRICEQCQLVQYETIPFTDDHALGAWQIVKEATCKEEGVRQRECIRCVYTEEEKIPATGEHRYSETVREATCTEAGEITYECEICGDIYIEEIAAHGHRFGEPFIKREPTVDEEGLQVQVCEYNEEHILESSIPRIIKEETETETETVYSASEEEPLFNGLAAVQVILNIGTVALFVILIRRDLYVIKWDRESKELLKKRRKREC